VIGPNLVADPERNFERRAVAEDEVRAVGELRVRAVAGGSAEAARLAGGDGGEQDGDDSRERLHEYLIECLKHSLAKMFS
jgi:hypothetical protein